MPPAPSARLSARPHPALVVTAVSVIAISLPATAQERGSFFSRNRSTVEEPVVRFPTDAVERDAARLYADARADIDANRLREAQRKLEVLVARHPHSALIDLARRDLQRVYGEINGAVSARPAALEPLPLAVPRPSVPLAAAAHPNALAAPAGPPIAPQSPAIRSASEDFRQQAGDRVFFPEGSTDLGARARMALEAQANWLNRHADVRIVIEGHADDQGSRDINKQLAEQRAEVVRLRLNDLGIADDRMRIAAFGRNEPLADCAEQHCKAQNRRVVTTIVHVPVNLGFENSGRRSLGSAAGVVGQPAPLITLTPASRAP